MALLQSNYRRKINIILGLVVWFSVFSSPIGAQGIQKNRPTGAIQDKDTPAEALVWSGPMPHDGDFLSLIAVTAIVDGNTVIFGAVWDPEGLSMIFADSTDNRPLMSEFFYPIQGFSTHMVALWSDGLCYDYRVRSGKLERFQAEPLWLKRGVPSIPRKLLGVTEKILDPHLKDVRNDLLNVIPAERLVNQAGTAWVRTHVRDIPRFLDERLGAIKSRFYDLEGRLAVIASIQANGGLRRD